MDKILEVTYLHFQNTYLRAPHNDEYFPTQSIHYHQARYQQQNTNLHIYRNQNIHLIKTQNYSIHNDQSLP